MFDCDWISDVCSSGLDGPALAIDATSVLVLKHAGPKGAPGMPEWGAAPIPARLLKQGVKDMVRISDARMSGTSYGTVVLHVAPEAAIGGAAAPRTRGGGVDPHLPEPKPNRPRSGGQPPA